MYNSNLRTFGPPIPEQHLEKELMKDLILAKIFNGLLMTTYYPPLNRLFFIPRQATLDDIISKFPYQVEKKERKLREKNYGLYDATGWFKININIVPEGQQEKISMSPKKMCRTKKIAC